MVGVKESNRASLTPLADAFRWSEWRTVAKTATVSMQAFSEPTNSGDDLGRRAAGLWIRRYRCMASVATTGRGPFEMPCHGASPDCSLSGMDFPDIAEQVAQEVAEGRELLGQRSHLQGTADIERALLSMGCHLSATALKHYSGTGIFRRRVKTPPLSRVEAGQVQQLATASKAQGGRAA